MHGFAGWVAGASAVLAVLVTALVDWSPTARQDPARAVGNGPIGVMLLGASRHRPVFGVGEFLIFMAVGAALVGCGFATAWGRPNSRVGLLLECAGLVWLAGGLRFSSLPWAFTAGAVLSLQYMPLLIHAGLAFPAGRVTARLERSFLAVFYGFWAASAVIEWLPFDPRRHVRYGTSTSHNLLLVADRPSLSRLIGVVSGSLYLIIGGTSFVLLFLRWHGRSRAYRSAFAPLWVAYFGLAVGKVLITLAAGDVPGTHNLIVYDGRYWSVALVPAAFVVALSRYRRASAAIGHVLVDVDLDEVHAGLQDALRRATRDPELDLLVSGPSGVLSDVAGRHRSLDQLDPRTSRTVYSRSGESLGVICHDEVLLAQPDLLAAAHSIAAMALDNERLTARLQAQLHDVQQSSERVVAATEAERRRIERDIHDGAQQRMVAAALLIRRAMRSPQPEHAQGLLTEGSAELDAAITELRELARGMLPPLLRDRGLDAALRSLAERAPLPCVIAGTTSKPLSDSVAACAYFVVSEAITNAAKHASASHLLIELVQVGDQLSVRIADDGSGGATEVGDGGLAGLRDRAIALGGTFTTQSGPNGTTLRLALPNVIADDRVRDVEPGDRADTDPTAGLPRITA